MGYESGVSTSIGSLGAVRFVIIVFIVVLLALAGLYAYGLSLKPDTHTIEQEAIGAGDAS
ncbi:MAG: hypothetical protein KDA46_06320 [Parvularculaceae bacterium]|nr:hypothetical protein [Parvularculaceae bacterium]